LAKRNLADISAFIAIDNPAAAIRMEELISNAAARLSNFPNMGRRGSILGTRELIPHPSYRIVYRLLDETVWILTVAHTSRQWPPLPDKGNS
jgi:addiction module RelE/StbE family toxin